VSPLSRHCLEEKGIGQYPADMVLDPVEGFEHWDIGDKSPWEHYVGGGVEMHSHVGFSLFRPTTEGHRYGLCIRLKPLPPSRRSLDPHNLQSCWCGEAVLPWSEYFQQKLAVLVGTRQLAEPYEFRPAPMRPSIRLITREFVPDASANSWKPISEAHAVKVRTARLTDRELHAILAYALWSWQTRPVENQLPGEVIQGGAKIGQRISDQETPSPRRSMDRGDPEDHLLVFRFELSTESNGGIGLAIGPSGNFSIETFGVAIRPLPLRHGTRKVKPVRHGD
jgi:hypothetical protein